MCMYVRIFVVLTCAFFAWAHCVGKPGVREAAGGHRKPCETTGTTSNFLVWGPPWGDRHLLDGVSKIAFGCLDFLSSFLSFFLFIIAQSNFFNAVARVLLLLNFPCLRFHAGTG